MIKKCFVTFVVFLLFLSFVPTDTAISSEPASAPSSAASSESYPQDYPKIRTSNYTIENRSIAPYPEITTSPQEISPSNGSLLERTLDLNLTVTTIEVTFDLTTDEVFLAVDGASQSFVLRVTYAIYYPNGTLATETPITTTATSPMHFYILSPPLGTWRIVVSLIDTGETTAWIQAISYNRGTKHVTDLEKEQIHLLAGQALYFKIPVNPPTDWFYLYVNKFAGENVDIILFMPVPFNELGPYKYYQNFASEFFTSKDLLTGVYLLEIINYGSTDIFIEIMRPSGIKFTLNVDQGNTIKCQMRYDLEFFTFTVGQSYDWIALDGAVVDEGMIAEYILIDPNLDVIFDDYSWDPSAFIEKLAEYPMMGSYVIAIFGHEYAIATIKLTSATNLGSINNLKLDQNWTFTQSGQTFYLKILQSQKYFMFAATTLSSAYVKFTLFNPDLSSSWSWGPSTGMALYPPTKPTVPFSILKMQGQNNSSALIHIRFQGMEDYSIEAYDFSFYSLRCNGDLIVANITIRESDYVLQNAYGYDAFVALYDNNYDEKWSGELHLTMVELEHMYEWRKGYENPSSGEWLQIVIGASMYTEAWVFTIQSGDESQTITTPFQSFETCLDIDYAIEYDAYKVQVDNPKWFGIVSQLLSVNMSSNYQPFVVFWVYDSTLAKRVPGKTLRFSSWTDYEIFKTYFWPDPDPGTWLFVIGKFHGGLSNPLNCSFSFVSDLDFHRDWPTNLTGAVTSFLVIVGNETYNVSVMSNSTISDFVFNEGNREIHFNASGPEGTEGFSVVTIPKQLANRPFTVLIDGEPQMGVLSVQNDTHSSIYFSYTNADHEVEVVPEFPSWFVLQLFMFMVIIVAILAKKKPHANPKS